VTLSTKSSFLQDYERWERQYCSKVDPSYRIVDKAAAAAGGGNATPSRRVPTARRQLQARPIEHPLWRNKRGTEVRPGNDYHIYVAAGGVLMLLLGLGERGLHTHLVMSSWAASLGHSAVHSLGSVLRMNDCKHTQHSGPHAAHNEPPQTHNTASHTAVPPAMHHYPNSIIITTAAVVPSQLTASTNTHQLTPPPLSVTP